MIEFKSFGKIEHINRLHMTITQKLHGTNAQIYIYETENGLDLLCGSRTRWLAIGDDNYGFAAFVLANKQEFIDKLGPGSHYGEWCGPGINSGEGLTEKKLYLFNWRRWKDEELLPERVSKVPVLYTGKFSLDEIKFTMDQLKQNGSRITPGFMFPEGVVVEVGNNFYKRTFDIEEVAWNGVQKKKERKERPEGISVDHLLQPLRLEKLLSKDERYAREYPNSLPDICRDYTKDLEDEGQITGTEDEVSAIKKALGRKVFPFIKSFMN